MSHWVDIKGAQEAIREYLGYRWYGLSTLRNMRRKGVFGPLSIRQPNTKQVRYLYDIEGILEALRKGAITIPGIKPDWDKIVKRQVPYLDLHVDTDLKPDWIITPEGDLLRPSNDYLIEADRLEEDDWMLHLMTKDWMDFNTFLPVYFKALNNKGAKKIQIKITY